MNMPGRRPLAQIICLIPMLLLAFCWVDRAAATTSQNSAETSSPNLKWLASSPSLLGFNTVKLETTVGNIGDLKGVYSVIIVRNNDMVVERYFREGTRTKPHNLKSATKSVMAALTGIAIEKGYLRLDQPIGDFLPQVKYLADPRKADITVLHLLTMTSGLEQTSYQAYNSLAMNSTDWVWTILNRSLVADPGTKHQYSTGDAHILSAVLTGATGMSTRAFAEKYLFGPLGISVKGWEIDPKGINQGGNNLSLIPLDMALFGQLYLDGGIYRNQQIIPKWWVEASTRPNYLGKHELYGYYSYLWYSRPMGANAFVAVGYGGQYIYVSPEYNCVVVITSTLESKGKPWEKELFDYIQEGLLGSIEPEQQLPQVKYDGKDAPTFYESGPVSSSAASGEKRKALAVTTLNLRKGPSKSTAVIKLLDGGTVLEIQEQQGSWFKVQAVNLNGWVSAEYVRLITPERIQLAKRQPEAAGPVRQELAAKAPAPETPLSQQDTVLKQSQNLVEQLQSRIETFQKTQQQLEDDLNRTREKMVTEQQATARLETERKKLKQELAAERTQRKSIEQQFLEKEADQENVNAELAMAKKRIESQKYTAAELKAALDKSALKLAWLQKDLEAQQKLVVQSESDRKDLESHLAGLQDQLLSQTDTLTTVQSKRDTLKAELAASQKQAEDLKSSMGEALALTTNSETELAKVQKELQEHQQVALQATTKQKQLEHDLKNEQKKLENIVNELQKSHARRQNLEARLADMNQELENQQRTTRQSEIIRQSQEAELAELQSQIAEQAATLTKTQTKGTTLQAEMAALQKELSTGQITILRVTSANIDLEKNNKSLEEKLAATLNQKAVLEAALKTTPAPAKEPEVLVVKVEESALKPSKPEPHKVSVPAGPTFRLTGKTAATREKTPASEPEAKIQKSVIAATEKPDFDGVDVFIKSWAKAWEQKHVDSYLAHYSKKFQPSGKISLAAWKKQRRQRLSNPKLIKIDTSEVKHKTTSASRVRVDFTQKYQSNTYSDLVVKTLDLQWENGGWAIVKETSRAI